MTFIAQLNLAQLTDFDTENTLPSNGMLYFFIASPSQENWEHEMIYTTEKELFETQFPDELTEDCHFSALKMTFEPIYTFPCSETLEIESLSENDKNAYYELDERIFTNENNQILGHTYSEQSDVKWDWAHEFLGLENSSENEHTQRAEINKIRNEFINLLQFSVDNAIPDLSENFFISSMGYFGILKKDLEAGNFDKTVLIYQNS